MDRGASLTYLDTLRERWTNEATFHGVLSEFDGHTPEQFFQTGQDTIREVMTAAAELDAPQRFDRALDFGCGMGRLTRALADRFEYVLGLDISPRMIEVAQEFDSRPDYRLMDLDLPATEPVDLLVSMYVLQHLEEGQASEYLDAFPSLLAEGGIGMVQASYPSEDGGIGPGPARRVLGKRLVSMTRQGGWRSNPIVVSYMYWFTR